MLSFWDAFRSKRPSARSWLSVMSATRKKLFAPAWFGSGTRANMAADVGSMRLAGIVLPGKGWPVRGSRMAVDPKFPRRWSRVGTFVMRVTPRVMRVPS